MAAEGGKHNMHVCRSHKTSDSNLLKLPPNAKVRARLKRRIQKFIIVSVRHPLTPFFFRSRAAIAAEKRRHSRSRCWWVIHPCSVCRYTWNAVMVLNFLYFFFVVPYIIAFHRLSAHNDSQYMYMIYPAQVICFVDVLLNFITGFASTDGHEIFLKPIHIIRHYVKGYFVIDLISSIPFNLLNKDRIQAPGSNSDATFLIPECLPLLKLIRLVTLRQYIKQLCMAYGSSHAQNTVIWLVILTILILHWNSCATYAFPHVVMHTVKDTMENSRTYMTRTKLYTKSPWSIYLTCLHVGISNLVGSSFIEFSFSGMLDKVLRCIILILGRGCMIYLIVIVLQLVKSSAESEIKFQEKMHHVKEYIYDKRLPKSLQEKLISYYEYRFQGNYFKENVISNTLSSYLNQEAIMHSNLGLLETATIFHNLPRSELGNLISVLKPCIYLKNDIIYKAQTKGSSMYFIASGTVALITFSGIEVCHLHDGGHFGEMALIFPDQKYCESVITLEVCELLRFDFHDFRRVVSVESKFYHRLKAVALQTQEKTAAMEKVYSQENHTE